MAPATQLALFLGFLFFIVLHVLDECGLLRPDEDDRRLEFLHTNVRKFGTISNTLAQATKPRGQIRRR